MNFFWYNLTMKKNIIIILSVVILVFIAAGIAYAPEYKINKENDQRIKDRRIKLEQSNPETLKNLEQSLRDAENKVREQGGSYQDWIDVGVPAQALGDYVKAENAYNRAISINSYGVVAWNNLATLQREQQRYDEAKKTYLSLIDLLPTEISSYTNLSEMYLAGQANGTKNDALVILRQGITNTGNPGLQSQLEALEKTP
jgi:cytochrome c-type biogenesis protein CcmH/NrfG